MGDRTAAERQRRYRAHKSGDHTLCDPGRCDPSTVTVTRPVTRNAVTVDLGRRGQRLWEQLTKDVELKPAERVLLEESCRIADRLDKLDGLLTGDAADWLMLVEDRGNPERQIVVIDRPLAEARQQATALKQLLADLRQSMAGTPEKPASVPEPARGGVGDVPAGVTSLAARIAAKRGDQTAG